MLFRKRVPWYVSVPLIAGTALCVGAARWPGEVPHCSTAASWVRDHSAELPATLAGFNMYTQTYRVAIFNALPIGVQKRLWAEQLEAFVAPPSTRSPAQRAVFEHAGATQLTPHQVSIIHAELARLPIYFNPALTHSQREAAIDLRRPILEGAFTPSLDREIFETLGTSAETGSTLARNAAPTRLATLVADPLSRLAKKLVSDCQCNLLDDSCCAPQGPCIVLPTGCGFFGGEECDGTWATCRPALTRRTRR
jgi:hypothetical protein